MSLFGFWAAKVRISEQKAKEKLFFLFFFERKYFRTKFRIIKKLANSMRVSQLFLLIELEVTTSVVVRDVLHHLAQQLTIIGQKALLYVVTQHIAEDATEVFMTWIAEE